MSILLVDQHYFLDVLETPMFLALVGGKRDVAAATELTYMTIFVPDLRCWSISMASRSEAEIPAK